MKTKLKSFCEIYTMEPIGREKMMNWREVGAHNIQMKRCVNTNRRNQLAWNEL